MQSLYRSNARATEILLTIKIDALDAIADFTSLDGLPDSQKNLLLGEARQDITDIRRLADEYDGIRQGMSPRAEDPAFSFSLRQFLNSLGAIQAAADAADRSRLALAISSSLPSWDPFASALNALIKLEKEQADAEFVTGQNRFRTQTIVLTATLAFSLLVALLGYRILARSIVSPILGAVKNCEQIASGDLNSEVTGRETRDELGRLYRSFLAMRISLISTVTAVRAGSEQIASATDQISAGNADLSARTERQAIVLQSASTNIDQIAVQARRTADNAESAKSLIQQTAAVAHEGNRAVERATQTMNSIAKTSLRMTEITEAIEALTSQTNILSLNAAVESARAGEHGRGFAVVAQEVRSLAQRCANSAREIRSLIEDSTKAIKTGEKEVENTGRRVAEIILAIQETQTIVGEIATAALEQSTSISATNEAVSNIDRNTQQNVALVEEASAASLSLQEQVAQLLESVRFFKLETAT